MDAALVAVHDVYAQSNNLVFGTLLGIVLSVCIAFQFLSRAPWRCIVRPGCIERVQSDESVEQCLPDPSPLPDFVLSNAKTRDYLYVNKTLRYPYYQTMAHQPMHIDNWLEMSTDYEHILSLKKSVILEHGCRVLDSLPENDLACQELLETIVDWLPKRYPTLFRRLRDVSDDGIYNEVTGERFRYKKHDFPSGVAALQVISRLTECDFLMGAEREDGHVYFVGGLVAIPGSYLLSEKIGKSMAEVHDPVPQFNQKLHLSVERTLTRMSPSAPFERSSWAIVDDRNLFWHNIATLKPGERVTADPSELLLRIDRQTFRKLPRTKGIVFGVHPFLRPLSSLRASPLVPALLQKILTGSSRDLLIYKTAPAYETTLVPWLEKCTREQITSGLVTGDERVQDFRDHKTDFM